jgi:hypothetical protein
MLNPEQKQLITSTLQSILNSAVMSTVWQLPLWARLALGAGAFGVLFWMLQ